MHPDSGQRGPPTHISPERKPHGPPPPSTPPPSTLELTHRSRRAAKPRTGPGWCVLPVDLGAAQPRLSSRSACAKRPSGGGTELLDECGSLRQVEGKNTRAEGPPPLLGDLPRRRGEIFEA